MVTRRGLLWSFLATAAFAAAAVLWLQYRLTQPDEWDERVADHWRLHHMRWAASHSLHTDLVYGKNEIVATNVHTWKYYGDDCLAYGAAAPGSVRYYFVCGRRRPLVIGGDVPAAWTFDDDVLRERGVANNDTALAGGARVLRIKDLKSAAERQPTR